jgi:hypothetical protein
LKALETKQESEIDYSDIPPLKEDVYETYRLSSESPVLQGGDVESGCTFMVFEQHGPQT